MSSREIAAIKMGMRRAPYALTERGLYMLATILKGEVATRATLAIVNTYAQVRSMVRARAESRAAQDYPRSHKGKGMMATCSKRAADGDFEVRVSRRVARRSVATEPRSGRATVATTAATQWCKRIMT